jgi:preprotein translocase subunit YajC
MITTWGILAEAAGNAQQQPGGFTSLLVMFGPMILIFLVINHFLVSRPQQREQARQQDMLSNLKKNDRVLTVGGIVGQVVSLSEDKKEITLQVADNTRLKFRTEFIRGLLDKAAAEGTEGAKAT